MSYKYETNKDSQNFTPANLARQIFGMDRVIEGITLHWWGDPGTNPQFDSVVNYLLDNASNTSAHYIATGTGRRVACIVDPADIAHHSGSAWGNARTLGLELDPRNRPEDRDVLAELIADIRSAYGDVPLYWHNYFISTSCPGVYKAIIEELDALSYTKYSATEWGQGGDVSPKTPAPTPVPTPPVTIFYKLIIDMVQVAAYSTEANAYKGYVEHGKTGAVVYGNMNVTQELITKFTTPSPTTQTPGGVPLPDTGKPVTAKDDYVELAKENNTLIKQLLELVKAFLDKFNNIFKG